MLAPDAVRLRLGGPSVPVALDPLSVTLVSSKQSFLVLDSLTAPIDHPLGSPMDPPVRQTLGVPLPWAPTMYPLTEVLARVFPKRSSEAPLNDTAPVATHVPLTEPSFNSMEPSSPALPTESESVRSDEAAVHTAVNVVVAVHAAPGVSVSWAGVVSALKSPLDVGVYVAVKVTADVGRGSEQVATAEGPDDAESVPLHVCVLPSATVTVPAGATTAPAAALVTVTVTRSVVALVGPIEMEAEVGAGSTFRIAEPELLAYVPPA